MPVLDLPPEFLSSNDTKREGTAVATLRTDTSIANMYIGFVLDNLPTFRNISKTQPSITVELIPLQVSFTPPAGDEPFEFDPSVNKYLIIKVHTTNTLV